MRRKLKFNTQSESTRSRCLKLNLISAACTQYLLNIELHVTHYASWACILLCCISTVSWLKESHQIIISEIGVGLNGDSTQMLLSNASIRLIVWKRTVSRGMSRSDRKPMRFPPSLNSTVDCEASSRIWRTMRVERIECSVV